jgi:hypothetical protein
MSVWLTPGLTPVYGGTYFPPTDIYYGHPGFKTLLTVIASQVLHFTDIEYSLSEVAEHFTLPRNYYSLLYGVLKLNRRFGETYRLHQRDNQSRNSMPPAFICHLLA